MSVLQIPARRTRTSAQPGRKLRQRLLNHATRPRRVMAASIEKALEHTGSSGDNTGQGYDIRFKTCPFRPECAGRNCLTKPTFLVGTWFRRGRPYFGRADFFSLNRFDGDPKPPCTPALSVPYRDRASTLTLFPRRIASRCCPTRYGDNRRRPEPTREGHPPAEDRLRTVLWRREEAAAHRHRVAHRNHAEALQRPRRGT